MYIFEKTMVLIDEFKCTGVNYSILKIQLMHGRHVCIYQSVLRNIWVNNSCMNYACKQYQNFFFTSYKMNVARRRKSFISKILDDVIYTPFL